MTEMTPAERVALDTLRRGPLAKMTDADFAALEQEVAAKGLRNLDGWFAGQIRKAAEVVLKHPGHGDQSVHGAGKRGGSSGGASTPPAKTPSGRRTQAERGNKAAQEAMDAANLKVPATASKAARFRANEAREHHAKARQTDDPQQKAYHLKNAKASAKRASELFEDENFHDAAEAFKDASDAMGRASAFNSAVEKAVEPVEKHPGHADQSVHGGGRRKGGASSSAPASSGGGGSGGSVVNSTHTAALDKADALIDKHEAAINKSNLPKATKTEALYHLGEARATSKKMREAKSIEELSELRWRATDSGELYKGIVREAGSARRNAHYRTAQRQGRIPKPYKERELLGGLNDYDIQDVFDTFPVD